MQLKIKNIKKSFENKVIFENFNYTFERTGIYAVVGDSGAGKTTLLRIIAGLDKAYEGEISGGGTANVSFTFQEYRLFPLLTALENAVVPNGDMENESLVQRAKEILFSLGFSERDLSLLPSELSGGMKQRVALARAFLRTKPVLLLDEPTKELDETIREALYNLILKESEVRLVIIVSHNTEDLVRLKAVEIKI